MRALLCILPLLLATACTQQTNFGASNYPAVAGAPAFAPSQYYPPPGPPDDPWGPYIREAAAQYAIPEQWIRAVMAQESGGQEQAVSPAGAIGLMQVMPDTYEELKRENNLGSDPFEPEDNILAGAAYIKEMYARYGAPGFLAAYNAGPDALDEYLAGNSDLPDETVNYLVAVAPNLGNNVPMTGPLAAYATGGVEVAGAAPPAMPSAASFALGCDVNAAYDPSHPCDATQTSLAPAQSAAAGGCNADGAYDPDNPCTAVQGGTGSCDANLAYDPDSPCTPVNEAATSAIADISEPNVSAPALSSVTGSALYQPAPPLQPVDSEQMASSSLPQSAASPLQTTSLAAMPSTVQPPASTSSGSWAVQVGAFSNPGLARAVAEGARAEASVELANSPIALPATAPFGGLVLYRARLTHLSATKAAQACVILNGRQLPCIVVPESSA
jgi:D-alanyl-D-alanine carboxypeptidase